MRLRVPTRTFIASKECFDRSEASTSICSGLHWASIGRSRFRARARIVFDRTSADRVIAKILPTGKALAQMRRPQFSLRFLVIGTAFTAIAISAARSLTPAGTLAIPVIALASFLLLLVLVLQRRHRVSRLLFPYVLTVHLVLAFLFLSLGPACSTMIHLRINEKTSPAMTRAFRFIYHPISNAYCFAPEPVRSIGMRYLGFWFPDGTPLKDAGFQIQWRTSAGWQVVSASALEHLRDRTPGRNAHGVGTVA